MLNITNEVNAYLTQEIELSDGALDKLGISEEDLKVAQLSNEINFQTLQEECESEEFIEKEDNHELSDSEWMKNNIYRILDNVRAAVKKEFYGYRLDWNQEKESNNLHVQGSYLYMLGTAKDVRIHENYDEVFEDCGEDE